MFTINYEYYSLIIERFSIIIFQQLCYHILQVLGYVFLFTDMLIVTKTVRRGDKYTVIKPVSIIFHIHLAH